MSNILRYPIYVPSKGRWANPLTARFLLKDETPFCLVVEPQEQKAYVEALPGVDLLALPFSNRGSVIPARNWIKEHATAAGYERHWQLDDNIWKIKRRWHMRRVPCDSGIALAAVEDFTDRYENIAVAGLNYEMFLPRVKTPPFYLNCHVYSCSLILNSLPNEWRGRYNEDTDFCLQVLADGWCTVLVNAFLAHKLWTMEMRGGNTDELYQDDGRLKMARSLERDWPGVVTTRRRFQRPQHVVKDAWRRFDTPLKLKPGIDLATMESNEYGMKLKQVAPIKSESLRKAFAEHNA
ncbi:hypothetical protein LCGC14_1336590 [marine sediment metagenome]|uniref:TET-Associated Glycosyltransferase domain-containing protein n=1 Tax=marine sediment metagenome TaxID=412755 RepID=A0A0F9MVW0_9ZZZZ